MSTPFSISRRAPLRLSEKGVWRGSSVPPYQVSRKTHLTNLSEAGWARWKAHLPSPHAHEPSYDLRPCETPHAYRDAFGLIALLAHPNPWRSTRPKSNPRERGSRSHCGRRGLLRPVVRSRPIREAYERPAEEYSHGKPHYRVCQRPSPRSSSDPSDNHTEAPVLDRLEEGQ